MSACDADVVLLAAPFLQAKQSELEQLQSSLTADAAALSQQLNTFEERRQEAIRELQVYPRLALQH
jgi:hypothetical protein